MITIQDLSSVIDNDVLQDLFLQRNEIISNVSKEDKENLKDLYDKQIQIRNCLGISSKNLPNCFEESKEQVIECVENHIESSVDVISYFDEKHYKEGVLDGIVLIIKAINSKQFR